MRHLVFAFALGSLVSVSALAETYDIDKDHSSIDFTVKHLGISKVKGSFKDFEGKITMDQKNPKEDSAEVTIKASSIDTGTAKRDEHLKSPDFFDTSKFPEMTFKTTKVTKTGKNFKIDGLLTLHGVEKPVTLTAEFGGETKDPWGNQRIAFTATGKIDRTQFGLTWNKPLEKVGAMMIGNDINMEFNVEAIAKKDDKTASSK